MKSKQKNSHWQEKQELWVTLKGPPWMLIGCCFIPDGKNESNTKVGWRRVTQSGIPSERQPPSQEELVMWVEQLRDLEMAGRLPGSSTTRQLAWIVAEVGLAPTVSGEVGHVRPTTGGKTPQRVSKGWA